MRVRISCLSGIGEMPDESALWHVVHCARLFAWDASMFRTAVWPDCTLARLFAGAVGIDGTNAGVGADWTQRSGVKNSAS